MELKKEFNEMFFTKAFETKAKLSPELSVSLPWVVRSNSASRFYGRSK
ncbi:hypothetical protein LEP1GSC166_0830 [Leptospira kirschneri]|nr:hypothetical protein LEP1GSC166_0830 [Leptospira kirschneri]